jgi:hypothetical protein
MPRKIASILLSCGLAGTLIALAGVGGYVKGVTETRAKAVQRLYSPFEKEYVRLCIESNSSAFLDSPSEELLRLQWKASEYQKDRFYFNQKFPNPDPNRELENLSRLYGQSE